MKFGLVKMLNGDFRPAYESDREKAKKIKAGKLVECDITQPRNYQFHKKYFALINLVYQNQDRYTNIDHLRDDITIAAGYYTLRIDINGEERYEPRSISFYSMDEFEFADLYSKCIDVIIKYFHFDKESIISEVEQYF